MIDAGLKQSMLTYYDERAAEYDDLYTLGQAPGARIDRHTYLAEVEALGRVAAAQLSGELLDAPCGAGFWMQFYAERCTRMTLIDQSERMLAESRTKAQRLGVAERIDWIRADLHGHALPAASYDAVLLGFYLSHLTDDETAHLMARLRPACRPTATVVVFDSYWSPARQQSRAKVGRQRRRLEDGREFDIYKRYFSRQDLGDYRERYGLDLDIAHQGEAYIAACGSFV